MVARQISSTKKIKSIKKGSKLLYFIGPPNNSSASGDSDYEWLLREVIYPVMLDYPQFRVEGPDIFDETQMVTKGMVLDFIRIADILLVDITNSVPDIMYQLAIRHASQQPVIHFVNIMKPAAINDWPSTDWKNFLVHGYSYSEPLDAQNILRMEIENILKHNFYPILRPIKIKKTRMGAKSKSEKIFDNGQLIGSPKELASRIDIAVEAIAELRLNSPEVSDCIRQLEDISSDLKNIQSSIVNKSVQAKVGKALEIFNVLCDAASSSTGAKIIISGAVAGIVSLGGGLTVTAYAVTLAFWQGPKALSEAIKMARSKFW